MESLNCLLRQTISTATADEVCFIYVPKDQIDKSIFALRFGCAEVESEGVTYSFDKNKLQRCFKASSPTASVFDWTLSIPPYAERTITSVAVASTHNRTDHVVATYAPEHAATGMTVVHFFAKAEADAFKRSLIEAAP
jgi:hypothetical protein